MARNRRLSGPPDERGFTLIELMVAVMIIAVLLAVAIPSFLGAQRRASDRAAQSDLRNAVTAAKVVATGSGGEMTGVTIATLGAEEGAITFGPVGNRAVVGVVKSTGATPVGSTAVLLYKESPSGTHFGVVTTGRGIIGATAVALPLRWTRSPPATTPRGERRDLRTSPQVPYAP